MDAEPRFTEQFSSYACPGDFIATAFGDATYHARIHFDPDTKPTDFDDCYTPEMIESWKRDEWFYCTVEISAHVRGQHFDWLASLSGVECNSMLTNEYLTDVANELLPEAREELQKQLASLQDLTV